jgi:membrane protease YdiL (CAAX protease family)
MMKGRSILEASLVFAIFMVVTTMIPGVSALIRWEGRNLGGSYFTGILMVVLTLGASIVTGLDFDEIGLSKENWKRSLNMGLKAFMGFTVPQLLMTFLWGMGLDYREYWQSALMLSVLVIFLSFLLIRNLGTNRGDISRIGIIVLVLILIAPFIIGFTYGTLVNKRVYVFVWHILVGGFAEELLFRGYIQSTVNREYGTNWRYKGVSFGPGLLVSSIFYGLSRGLLTMNFGWCLYAFTLGIFYGVIREASGDIIGSGSANAVIDGFGATLLKVIR